MPGDAVLEVVAAGVERRGVSRDALPACADLGLGGCMLRSAAVEFARDRLEVEARRLGEAVVYRIVVVLVLLVRVITVVVVAVVMAPPMMVVMIFVVAAVMPVVAGLDRRLALQDIEREIP